MTHTPRTGTNPPRSDDSGHLAETQGAAGHDDSHLVMIQNAAAFEHCAHGIALGLPGVNRIIACNRAFASMLGRTAEEVAGQPILSVYAVEEHERVREGIAEADRVGTARYESRMVRADGSTIPVQMDVVSVRDEAGELIYRVATAQDITERRRAEASQNKSEERLAFALEASGLGAWSLDPASRTATRTMGRAHLRL